MRALFDEEQGRRSAVLSQAGPLHDDIEADQIAQKPAPEDWHGPRHSK